MNGMSLVTDQLKAVALHADWSIHARHMDDLDAELIEINQQVQTIIFLHDMVAKIDDQLFRRIASGEIAPRSQDSDLFLKANSLFAEVCDEILPKAEEFARKGFSVEGLSRFRAIAADPSAGFSMIEIARGAQATVNSDGSIMETSFDTALLDAASEKGNPFRHLGND